MTSFFLSLPPVAGRAGHPDDPVLGNPPNSIGPLKLLLAEPDPACTQLLEDYLAQHPPVLHTVTHEADLASALGRLGAEPFDAVLVDLDLAGAEWQETIKDLQTRAPGAAIVVLTATDDDAVALAAVRDGAQDYLVKSEVVAGRVLWRVVRYAIERKRAEEAIRERDSFVRLIVENVGDLVSVTDRDGRRLFNSRSYQGVLGDPERLRGTDAFLEIHPEDRERIQGIFRHTVTTGVGQQAEFRFIRADGSIRHMHSQGTPIKDTSGLVDRVVVVSRDITERKSAEEALRQSEQRYRDLLASATDYIYTVTLENGRPAATEHGPGCEAVTGYAPKDYAADSHLWYKMVQEGDRAAVLAQAAQAQAGVGTALEHRLVHKDGSIRWVRNTTVPRRNEFGGLVAYDGLVTDITPRKRAEERQAVQYAVARILADAPSLPEALPGILRTICEQLEWDLGAFWSLDEQAGVLRCQEVCNRLGPAAERFETCTRTAVFGSGFGFPGRIWKSGQAEWIPELSVLSGCSRSALARDMNLHAAFGFPIYLRGRVLGIQEFFSREMRKPDQEMVEVFRAMGNQIGQFIERRQAEERLKQACAELAANQEELLRNNAALQRAHEELRTTQMQLIQAARLELVGGLAASVAHDVKNPLANIRLAVRLLTTRPPAAEENFREELKAIDEDVTRATAILDDLLELSRRAQLTLRDEDLNALIEQSLRQVRFQITKFRITEVRELDPGLGLVPLDRIRMEEVCINLFMNAIDAMPAGGELRVRTYRRQVAAGEPQAVKGARVPWQAGDTVAVMEIDDTGGGIPPEDLPGIFDLVHRTTKDTGTGLGLWIVKNLVDLHGGMIRIHNRPEGGVRVTLTLQMKRRPEA